MEPSQAMHPRRLARRLFIALAALATAALAQAYDAPRIANYTLDVRLDTQTRIISGTAVLTWHNTTSHAAPDLRFHMYFNAWRNSKSSFLSSIRYDGRFDLSDYREQDWAYVEIAGMQVQAGTGTEEVTSSLHYIQPNDGNADDRTVLRLPLSQPVAPGDSIIVAFDFTTKVPRTFARTGTRGDYYFLAHWFPKIGVFEDNGQWNCHQYISTEYYANFGEYDVAITIPTGWVIGATGRLQETADNGDGSTRHRFVQAGVHEFAWTASPHFRVHEQRFEHPDLPAVDMRLLLMPDHTGKRDRYFRATAAALREYGLAFGAYPYGHVTVVDPAYRSGSGGMEYPTLFTGGTRWLSPIEMRSPESVTIHEAGHQFWYGIVANNEFEHAWLDEGFNTYSTSMTLEREYPNPVYTRRYFEGFLPKVFASVPDAERIAGADAFDGVTSEWKRDKMSTDSWRHGPGSYGLNSYTKPALMLRTLENYFGWETFQRIMSTYFERWKFRHPEPQDFFAIVNEIGGEDMSWYFDQMWDDAVLFDYAVESVQSERIAEAQGYVQIDGTLQFQQPAMANGAADADSTMFSSQVIVRRWGEGVFPVEVRITFADSSVVTEAWDGRARWQRYTYQRPAKIAIVEVDPERKLVLDVNRSNNSWTRTPAGRIAAAKWTSKWLIWLQSVLEFFAFFG